MLVRFSSTKTEPLLMFGDIAVQLIRMLGATGAVPGALSADDLPAAITRLRAQLQAHAAAKPPPGANDNGNNDEDDKEREPPVELAARAAPLLELLERAAANDAAVMWEAL